MKPICVTAGRFARLNSCPSLFFEILDFFGSLPAKTGLCAALCVLAAMVALPLSRAQSQPPENAAAAPATMQGLIRDYNGKPVPNATVSLTSGSGSATGSPPARLAHTDAAGGYRFEEIRSGAYFLHAEKIGYSEAAAGPINVPEKLALNVDLVLAPAQSSLPASEPQNAPAKPPTAKEKAREPEFYDEPQFTVAGVTQATNSGGHGSDIVLRTSEALAKATVSLSKESSNDESAASASTATKASLREAIALDPDNLQANRQLAKLLVEDGKFAEAVPYLERVSRLNPRDSEVHHLLGDAEEKLGNPLLAVREYQRAAELGINERDLFDLGTELLTHRALEPATTVFTKGHRMFPRSMRMLVALGVAWYARGDYERAARCLADSSDLDPGNPTPYLFLGRMQSTETPPSAATVERLRRFAELQPDNPLANYYYAVGVERQLLSNSETERSRFAESLLQKAVRLDPKLGVAYLQLGILYSRRGDSSRAISAYEKAIEVGSEEANRQSTNVQRTDLQVTDLQITDLQITALQLEDTLSEAHYRLGQAYLRAGDKARAQQQLQLHDQLSKKAKEDAERGRREIQQFVISLRNKDSMATPQP